MVLGVDEEDEEIAMAVAAKPKDDHACLLPADRIRPAPENELLYRPVRASDPEIRELAESISRHGLREPLVITRDYYILSGHRRYAACRLLGMREIPCRIEDISRYDPGFEVLLREFNRQRVKSFDETVRELAIDSSDDGDAYLALVAHRKAKSAVSGESLSIEGTKDRKRISRAKRPMLEAATRIISAQRLYWPLSDRRIHYALLNNPPLRHASKPESRYTNLRQCYNDLTDLLTRARLTGEIPFAAIEDPTRPIAVWDVSREVGGFIKRELRDFLKGYWRDLQQSQPNHIEIVGEKNTIEGSIKAVAMEHCLPYTLGRGYCSLDPRHKMYQRFKASGKDRLILLFLSDFDPEGEDIPHSFTRSMRDDFGIPDAKIVARKVCLTYGQVLERNLPRTFDLDEKKGGSRYHKFVAKYGKRAHELEALEPAELARLLEEAINEVLDIDAYNREVDAERRDAKRIDILRRKTAKSLAAALGASPEED
jgi:hypothetical protein